MAKNVILGTDWWTDCDDCVAVRLLCRADKKGLINFEGIGINACSDVSVPSLHRFISAEGKPDVEIGLDKEATDFHGTIRATGYQHTIINTVEGDFKSNEDVPDAVKLFRKILASADEKVDIVEIGFPQILSDLLKSLPDEYSKLSGYELVCEKVNALWIMAGKWDEPNGREHNFVNNHRSAIAGQYVCDNWPTEIYFLGWEAGHSVISGGSKVINNDKDLLQIAMKAHGSENGRSSWDPMTVVLMLDGAEKTGYDLVRGRARLNSDGSNNFVENPNGKHYYVVKNHPDSFYEDYINNLIK